MDFDTGVSNTTNADIVADAGERSSKTGTGADTLILMPMLMLMLIPSLMVMLPILPVLILCLSVNFCHVAHTPIPNPSTAPSPPAPTIPPNPPPTEPPKNSYQRLGERRPPRRPRRKNSGPGEGPGAAERRNCLTPSYVPNSDACVISAIWPKYLGKISFRWGKKNLLPILMMLWRHH